MSCILAAYSYYYSFWLGTKVLLHSIGFLRYIKIHGMCNDIHDIEHV